MVGSRRIDLPNWESYVRAPVDERGFEACRQSCSPALSDQYARIQALVEQLEPRRIACLGAGYLNDIPLESLIARGRQTYLVDFVPNICFEGVRGSIIERNEQGDCSCLFCHLDAPQEHCRGFALPIVGQHFVCAAFCPVDGDRVRCAGYVPGSRPGFLTHDVTAGRATHFAQQIRRAMPAYSTPEQAFRRALSQCRKSAARCDAIPIPDDSLDLVTSSMLVSQFEHEPYTYFARLLELRFGRNEILRKEAALNPLMENLRSELFTLQMEGHAEELYRLVNKRGGKVYLSVELFRSLPDGQQYFLVQGTTEVMEILGRYFFFDFDSIPPSEALHETKIGSGTSIVESFILTPRSDVR